MTEGTKPPAPSPLDCSSKPPPERERAGRRVVKISEEDSAPPAQVFDVYRSEEAWRAPARRSRRQDD